MSPKSRTLDEAVQRAAVFRARTLAHPALRALAEAARTPDVDLHLVGGVPRDWLLGREPADIDLALRPDPAALAARLREATGGTLVTLDEDRATLRLVCRGEGAPILDFARLRADTIEGDCRARDLKVNAIAIPLAPLLDSGEVRWIDPTGGIEDIREARIRFTSARAAAEDPLRLLRAYRFACELGFSITEEARATVREAAAGIRAVAPERISFELLRIVQAPRGDWAIGDLDRLGVLGRIVPELEEMRGVEQNAYHHLDVLGHSLATATEMARILAAPGAVFPQWGEKLGEYLAAPDKRPMLMLASLLHDAGKPRCRAVGPDGRVTFYGHAEVGSRLTTEVLKRLRLPNRQVDLATLWVHHHMRLSNHQSLLEEGRLPDRSLFRTFRKLGEDVVGEILLTLADLRATKGPRTSPRIERSLIDLGNRMLGLYFGQFVASRAAPRLLTGHDLIEMGIPEGPEVGRILGDLDDAALEGGITSREEALALARRMAAAGAASRETGRRPDGGDEGG